MLRNGGAIIVGNNKIIEKSPHRWEQPGNGPFVNFCRNWYFLFVYTRLGVTPEQIFRMYYGRNPDPIVEVQVQVEAEAEGDDNVTPCDAVVGGPMPARTGKVVL